jgi:hypothetical protein
MTCLPAFILIGGGMVAVKLKVPHVSQQGNKYWNDCGPGSGAAMVCSVPVPRCPTIDEVIVENGATDGKFTTIGGLMAMCAKYGVKMAYSGDADLDWYKQQIANGHPCIALLDYRPLIPFTKYNYEYAHFSPITGFDDEREMVTVLDTLTRPVEIPYSTFIEAISTPSPTLGKPNWPYQAITTEALRAQFAENAVRGGANLDLYHPLGSPAVSRLGNLTDVRMEFNMSRIHGGHGSLDRAAALAKYIPKLQELRAAGKRIWMDINHLLYGEGAGYVWEQLYANDQQFYAYADELVRQSEPIVMSLAPYVLDWLIWNEPDTKPENRRAAVPLKPHQYGYLFKKMSAMIRRVQANARVWVGEFVSGAGGNEGCIQYLKDSGIQPSEYYGISVHPYDYINFEDYCWLWRRFTNKPMAVTEFGPLGSQEQQATWRVDDIYNLILKFVATAAKYAIEVCIKYSWANGQDDGYGIVDRSDKMRFTTFGKTLIDALTSRAFSVPTNPPAIEFGSLKAEGMLEITPNTTLNLRDPLAPPSTNTTIIGAMTTGATTRVYSNKQVIAPYEWSPAEVLIGGKWVKCWFASKGTWRTRVKQTTVTYVDL